MNLEKQSLDMLIEPLDDCFAPLFDFTANHKKIIRAKILWDSTFNPYHQLAHCV